MDKKCGYCYPRCSEGGCSRSHNEYGCMGCGCESPFGMDEGKDWCYCDLCDPQDED